MILEAFSDFGSNCSSGWQDTADFTARRASESQAHYADTRWKGQETISLFAKNDHEIEDLQNLARGVLECDLNPPIVKPSIADVVELSGS